VFLIERKGSQGGMRRKAAKSVDSWVGQLKIKIGAKPPVVGGYKEGNSYLKKGNESSVIQQPLHPLIFEAHKTEKG